MLSLAGMGAILLGLMLVLRHPAAAVKPARDKPSGARTAV
jgi:hypothetical protein